MTYTVIISPHALDELDEAYQWLFDRTPQHAPEWHKTILEAISSLEQFPNRCPLAPDFKNSPDQIRQLLHGNRQHAYRILFASAQIPSTSSTSVTPPETMPEKSGKKYNDRICGPCDGKCAGNRNRLKMNLPSCYMKQRHIPK